MKKLDNYRVYNEIYHWQNCCHHKIFIDFDFDDDFFSKKTIDAKFIPTFLFI